MLGLMTQGSQRLSNPMTDSMVKSCADKAVEQAAARREVLLEEDGFIKAEPKGKGNTRTWYAGPREGWAFKTGDK